MQLIFIWTINSFNQTGSKRIWYFNWYLFEQSTHSIKQRVRRFDIFNWYLYKILINYFNKQTPLAYAVQENKGKIVAALLLHFAKNIDLSKGVGISSLHYLFEQSTHSIKQGVRGFDIFNWYLFEQWTHSIKQIVRGFEISNWYLFDNKRIQSHSW